MDDEDALAREAPWFAAEVRRGRAARALRVLDGMLGRVGSAPELLAWARRIRSLVVAADAGIAARRRTPPRAAPAADAPAADAPPPEPPAGVDRRLLGLAKRAFRASRALRREAFLDHVRLVTQCSSAEAIRLLGDLEACGLVVVRGRGATGMVYPTPLFETASLRQLGVDVRYGPDPP